jgi:hypothetical protein
MRYTLLCTLMNIAIFDMGTAIFDMGMAIFDMGMGMAIFDIVISYNFTAHMKTCSE